MEIKKNIEETKQEMENKAKSWKQTLIKNTSKVKAKFNKKPELHINTHRRIIKYWKEKQTTEERNTNSKNRTETLRIAGIRARI